MKGFFVAAARVAQRVKEGGHNIPNDVIFRRYFAGIKNLFEIYMPIVDYWMIIDNAENPRKIVAKKNGDDVTIYNQSIFNTIKNYE